MIDACKIKFNIGGKKKKDKTALYIILIRIIQ
jgi:hypothetical protein